MQYHVENKISPSPQENLLETKDIVTYLDEAYLREINIVSTLRHPRRPSATLWRLLLISGDILLLLIVLTCIFTVILRFHLDLGMPNSTFILQSAEPLLVGLALLCWIVASSVTHTHELRNASNRFRSMLSIIFTLVIMYVLWLVFSYTFIRNDSGDSIRLIFVFLVVSLPIMSIWRVVFAKIMGLPRFLPQIVIVGVNAAGETLIREMRASNRTLVNILGFIQESSQEEPSLGNAVLQYEGLPILGGKSILHYLVQKGFVDMIVMAIDYQPTSDLFQYAIDAVQMGIAVVPIAILYERIGGKIPVKHLGDQWSMALPLEHTTSPTYLLWNRAMDIVFGLCGTLVLLTVLPIIALLIHLDSPGPIFYQQERLGYQGRKFFIRKFRSMYTNAERAGRAQWTKQNDTRITRTGRFLRATHLDELPQVFNILNGEMSLIGPRPEREEFINELEKTIPFYRCRLSVKPGLTGWAQVKYHYGSSDHDALIKLQYDLYYIKHRSFTLELFIIIMTVFEVLLRRGV